MIPVFLKIQFFLEVSSFSFRRFHKTFDTEWQLNYSHHAIYLAVYCEFSPFILFVLLVCLFVARHVANECYFVWFISDSISSECILLVKI